VPKVVDVQKKKEEIIQKAIDIFSKLGYRRTNLGHIAKKCNMGRTTMYQYFKNKDQLFESYVVYLISCLQKDVGLVFSDKSSSSFKKIKSIIEILLTKNEYKNLILSLFEYLNHTDKAKRSTKTREMENKALELKYIFEKLLEEGMQNREFKNIDTKATSLALFNIIEGAVLYVVNRKIADFNEYIKSSLLLLDGLKI
jgi:AcrR family transcriptional regulator